MSLKRKIDSNTNLEEQRPFKFLKVDSELKSISFEEMIRMIENNEIDEFCINKNENRFIYKKNNRYVYMFLDDF